MNSLADVWVRSGKESKYLYPGSKKEVITELKSWLKRRETLNNILAECCDVFPIVGSQLQIRALLESHHQSQNQEDLDQIASLKAMQMRSRIPIRRLEIEKAREDLLADFFLASFRRQGEPYPEVFPGLGREAEAGVSAFLAIAAQGYLSETKLETLMDWATRIQWSEEYSIRKGRLDAYGSPKGRESGGKSHPAEAYTAYLLGLIDVRAGETNADTENHVLYIADTLGNIVRNDDGYDGDDEDSDIGASLSGYGDGKSYMTLWRMVVTLWGMVVILVGRSAALIEEVYLGLRATLAKCYSRMRKAFGFGRNLVMVSRARST